MRPALLLCIFIAPFFPAYVFGQTIAHNEIVPVYSGNSSSAVMYDALAPGLAALYANPAAAVRSDETFLFDSSFWTIGDFSSVFSSGFSALGDSDLVARFADEIIDLQSDQPLGGGMATAVGSTGSGLNAALELIARLSGGGDSVYAAVHEIQLTAHIGWVESWEIAGGQLSGSVQLRPLIRTFTGIPDTGFDELLPTLSGTALPLDVGIFWQKGSYSLGAFARNISGPKLYYTLNSYELVLRSLTHDFGVPVHNNADSADIQAYLDGKEYYIPPVYGFSAMKDFVFSEDWLKGQLTGGAWLRDESLPEMDFDFTFGWNASFRMLFGQGVSCFAGLSDAGMHAGAAAQIGIFSVSTAWYNMELASGMQLHLSFQL